MLTELLTDVTAVRTTDDAPAGSVDAMLAATAALLPDKVAIIGEEDTPGGVLTYAELDALASTYACALQPLLSGPDQLVAISNAPHPSFVAAYYGAIRAGAVVVPVNPMLPEKALERILEQSGAVLALLTPEAHLSVTAMRGRLPKLTNTFQLWSAANANTGSALVRHADDEQPAAVSTTAEDLAVVLFTSGTTGPSKAAAISHRAVAINARQFGQAHHICSESVVLCHLPIISVMHMNAAVLAGASQLLCPAPNIADSLQRAARFGATHYYSLPVRLTQLATDPSLAGIALDSLQMIAAGNQTLATSTIRQLSRRFGVPVFQGYGLTESTHLAHTDGPDQPRPGSAGPPVAGSQSRIVDLVTGAVLEPHQLGQLQIRGPQLMRGYLNRPELVPFDKDGWFSTGDVGTLDSDDYLYVADRLVDVFHHDGQLISPSKLEMLLAGQAGVREVAVADQADGERGRSPVAFVVMTQPQLDPRGPVAVVNALLEPYERIRHVVTVEKVYRSATNGKVDRLRLRNQLAEHPATAS
jgi:long-chain acyl-CoA synthetase